MTDLQREADLDQAFHDVETRLANLEQAPHRVIERADAWLEATAKRLDKLEEQMKVIWPPELPPDPEERKLQEAEFDAAQRERHRVNRWHSTFNAALTGLCTHWEHDERLDVARLIVLASEFADRQHGPLK